MALYEACRRGLKALACGFVWPTVNVFIPRPPGSIGEYWIVNPFDRLVEVYWLQQGEFILQQQSPDEPLRPAAFPGLRIDPREIWAQSGE